MKSANNTSDGAAPESFDKKIREQADNMAKLLSDLGFAITGGLETYLQKEYQTLINLLDDSKIISTHDFTRFDSDRLVPFDRNNMAVANNIMRNMRSETVAGWKLGHWSMTSQHWRKGGQKVVMEFHACLEKLADNLASFHKDTNEVRDSANDGIYGKDTFLIPLHNGLHLHITIYRVMNKEIALPQGDEEFIELKIVIDQPKKSLYSVEEEIKEILTQD